jgi:nitroreductase
MRLDEAIRGRRSVRHFLPDPVPRADIEAMLEAARWAPSSTNFQPWRFLVVARRDLIQQMAQLVYDRFDEALKEVRRRRHEPEARVAGALLRFMRGYGSFFGAAPVVIAAFGMPYSVPKFRSVADAAIAKIKAAGGEGVARIFASTVDKSVAMAVQNLLLKAHAMGYGAVAIDTPLAVGGQIKAVLEVPPDDPMRLIMLVALGRPAERPPSPSRRPVAEIARFYEPCTEDRLVP